MSAVIALTELGMLVCHFRKLHSCSPASHAGNNNNEILEHQDHKRAEGSHMMVIHNEITDCPKNLMQECVIYCADSQIMQYFDRVNSVFAQYPCPHGENAAEKTRLPHAKV